jgi:PAS domain S-box-containing protein
MEEDRTAQGTLDAKKPNTDNPFSPSPSRLNAKHHRIVNQHLPIGIVETSFDGKYLDASEEFCRMLGYEREELLQRGIKDVTHEEDYHVDIKLHGQLVAGEIPHYKIEKRFVRKDGQIIWTDLTRSAVRDASGTALYVVGLILDITERHLAEEALLRARTKAERTADRITRLQTITAALTAIATTQQVAEMILEQGTQATRAAAGLLVQVLENGREIRMLAARGYPPANVRMEALPLSTPGPLSDCIRTKQPVWLRSRADLAVHYPEWAKLWGSPGSEAAAALPLIVGERVIGGLAFSFGQNRDFDQEDREFLLAVAQQCAQALERAHSEEALRESERKFSLIYDKLPFAATLTRPQDGLILDVNESFEKIFGYSKQEVIGRTLLELGLHPDAEARERILAELQEKQSARGIELTFETKSNGLRIFLANLDIVELRGETYILQTDQDITERKQLEVDLRASELLYRAIAGNIPGGGVYVVDKNLRYLVAEGPITEAFGLSREALEGRTVSEIFSGARKQRLEDYLRRAFTGEIVSSESVHNGRTYWSQYAMMNETLGYAIIVTLDITERKQTLEALRESEERFRAILSQATAGIVRKDTEGMLLFVNDAFCNMVGYTSSELVLEGKSCWDLTHPDDLEENKRLFARMIQDGIPFQMERRLIRQDGSILWANVSVAPILDASGKAVSAVGVEVDITARKQAEDSLRQLNLELESRVEERTAELQAMNQSLQENRRRLQSLSQRLVQVQEEERRSLARELHDRVGQSLMALKLNLTIIQGEILRGYTEQLGTRLADSIQLVAEVITLVRDVMSNLRPTILDDYGLEPALQTYVSEFRTRYGIPVMFEKQIPPFPRLESSIEITLLRISQEALTNIARHSQASQAFLSLQLDEKNVYLTIEDNGIGIPSLEGARRPRSHGLKIMQERAEALEGTLKVRSTPGTRTKIEVIIPLPPGAGHAMSQEQSL